MCSIIKRRIKPPSSIIISIFVAIICWISTATVDDFGSFSESTLHRLAMASSLSYLSVEKIKQSPYYNECKLEPITQVVDPTSESGATIFRVIDNSSNDNNNREHQQLVVACRGSANPKNFGTNLKFNLVPATRLSQNYIPDNALVHEGFQSAAVGLWKELAQPLMKEMEKTSSSSITFTGHSLGAATSLLTAVHYQASNSGDRGPLPDIVTFGGPKLCNSELARHLRNNALSKCNILHLVHSSDPILANNQKLWNELGFENVGIELQCDPNKPIVYYREDDAPRKGGIAWNIVDHCKYMVRYILLCVICLYCCFVVKYLTLLKCQGVFVGPRL